MITRIAIDGFKSFHNFEMEFSPFTVIAGANSTGKSNLFDALKLLGRLAETDNLKKAFREQRGDFLELFTQYKQGVFARKIRFEVDMLLNKDVTDLWGNSARLRYTRLRYSLEIERFTNKSGIEDLAVKAEHLENFKHKDDKWIKRIPAEVLEEWRPKVKSGRRAVPYIKTEVEQDLPVVLVPQDGKQGGNKRRFPLKNASRTVLSSFGTIDFPHALAVKQEMQKWKFAQLNPEALRQPTDKNSGEDVIAEDGHYLAAALYRIKQEDPYHLKVILRKLQKFLPQFIGIDVIDDNTNKHYLIQLKDHQHKLYSSRVLSEGTLRILALCVINQDPLHNGLLCFEEPENGVPPYRIGNMAELLRDLSIDFTDTDLPLRQVVVNTHSSVLVDFIYNKLEDRNVSIWYARMQDRVATVNGQRLKLGVSKILPVAKNSSLLSLAFSKEEEKITAKDVQTYLNTATSS